MDTVAGEGHTVIREGPTARRTAGAVPSARRATGAAPTAGRTAGAALSAGRTAVATDRHTAGYDLPFLEMIAAVCLGTGGPLLFGGDVIREHFKGFIGKEIDIVQEEYFPISLGDTAV